MCPIGESSNLEDGKPASHGRTGPPAEPPDYVPSHPACIGAYHLARALLPESIFNHSIRVYLLAKAFAENENSTPSNLAPLFVACALHDIGCAQRYNGPQRFEVEGADAAVAHLKQYEDFSAADIHDVWQSIAIHTSPGIAERLSPLARLVRMGVMIDFGRKVPAPLHEDVLRVVVQRLPRLQIEKELGDVIVAQALEQRGKAPAPSWPGILLRGKLENPDWDGVNKAF